MKALIASVLLGLSLTIVMPLLFAQHDQNTQKLTREIETLKKQISTLKHQLQTVEDEKLELIAKLLDAQGKLADANTKVMNMEFSKFERGLRDSNDEWLWTWIQRFVTAISVFVLIIGGAFWFWLRSSADQLIASSVERSLSGFKAAVAEVNTLKGQLREAMGQVNILQDQIRILEKNIQLLC